MKNSIRKLFLSEKGDTNYIAIILILCVVIMLAVVFKEMAIQGMHTAAEAVKEFLHNLLGI